MADSNARTRRVLSRVPAQPLAGAGDLRRRDRWVCLVHPQQKSRLNAGGSRSASVDRTEGLIPLLRRVRDCRVCEAHLSPRPLLQASESARILIVGQAPGARAHETGIPWNDASGARLRDWLGLDDSVFYDASTVAIIPVGFCFPGRGRSGDLAPRPECAPLWFAPLRARIRSLIVPG
ncbi:MAG: uracil-DNA glycosylase family protein [Burkholderiaceae bacterium]|nr:uracil-DNA glycosylase family protein [Burkholderiaceae bacterium]